jgi:hypothetical protein
MQNEEKYPDRRNDKRRDALASDPESEILPDQDKRHGKMDSIQILSGDF